MSGEDQREILISQFSQELAKVKAERDTAQAEAARLRRALRPFAEAAEEWTEVSYASDDTMLRGGYTLGDLRRARAALTQEGKGDG